MENLLDYKLLNSLHTDFHNKVKSNLLLMFNLDERFKILLAEIDFNKYAFSTDFFCSYFQSLLNRQYQLKNLNKSVFIQIKPDIIIQPISPNTSLADNYLINSPYMNNNYGVYSEPSLEEFDITSSKLKKAIKILLKTDESVVISKLLNSIAIYSGNGDIATSASNIYAQGRVYLRHVQSEYPLLYYLDIIVHESSHQYFNMIENLHPIISDYNETLLSVFKNQKRPIYIVFHAAFVLYRLISVYASYKEIFIKEELPYDGENYQDFHYSRILEIPCNYRVRMNVYLMKFQTNIDQLLASKAITDEGRALLMAMQNNIQLIQNY
ncbi:MAG: hypothetical protein P1U74_03545 [Legionellaceae bacterium]|nr:hypothetical protein [Legionellaceae bacterium]